MSKYLLLPLLFFACTAAPQKPAPAPAPKPQPKKEEAPQVEQNCTNPKLREGQILRVSLNIKDGKFIQLSDNSVWKVHPTNVEVAGSWLTPARIDISKSGDSDYPCKLTNMQTYSSISARRLASIDEAK